MLKKQIHWDIWKNWFNSLSYFSDQKNGSIRWDMFKKSGFNFYESCFSKKKKRFIFYRSCKKKEGFNSVSHVEKKEGFNSVSHDEQKGSILCVMLKRRVQLCELYWKEGFNSVSHRKIQFFESYSKKRFDLILKKIRTSAMRVTHHWMMTAEPQKLRTKFVLSFPNYTFYFASSKNKCQKSHSASQLPSSKSYIPETPCLL